MNVIMFHSVGNDSGKWYRNWLSVTLNHFETFCKFLGKEGYQAVFFEDWYAIQNDPSKDSKKKIILSFDDGYLDNWVYVYPILKKYNLKGTIFINPEFVDPSANVRANLEDVWTGKRTMNELQSLGFLNWPEIQAMDAGGVMDIQSHSMSHNFYFRSDKIKDIYTGQPNYDWLAWFHKPERKPFYVTEDQRSFVPDGYPVFEFGRALGLRRYFPNEEMIEFAVKLYDSKSTEQEKSSIISELNEKIKEFPGRFETDEEMEQRYRYELFESKRILEEKLNKKVEFLCWPGGGYNELSINLSIEAGYKASTIASWEQQKVLDNSGPYKRIQRIGMGSFITTSKGRHLVKSPYFLVHNFKGRSGHPYYRNLNRAKKLSFMIKDMFR
jgi:peptidoglycan/xylan/chitin deacetylase (PgdA/CDA1 family)